MTTSAPNSPPSSRPRRAAPFAWLAALIVAILFGAGLAAAHPEDEFCTPGDGGLDPALCRQLNALQTGGDPLARAAEELAGRGALETLWTYLTIGVGHILPGGLDHILFVLALFLSTRRLRSLALQVSAFTVAHTVTLALAASEIVSPPASVVEPLIAATIAFAAIETVILKEPPPWRLALVFGFGLIHGLGFAGFIGDLGLPENQFWSALIGFNIGVEIGQLSVVALAGALAVLARRIAPPLHGAQVWRRAVAIPGAAVIGLIGLYWTVERVFGG